MIFCKFNPQPGRSGEVTPFLPNRIQVVGHFRFRQRADGYISICTVWRTKAARQDRHSQSRGNGLEHEIALARLKNNFRRKSDLLAVRQDIIM